jgi:hypothetical protein
MVVFGGVGVVVVVGVLYFKSKSGSSSTSSTGTTATGTDPVTGLPYSEDNQIDPATGMTYLSEAQQYGSVSAAESSAGAGYGGALGSSYGYSGSAYGYPTYTTTDTSTTPGVYATNAQWAQAAQAGMTSLGYSPTDVAAALGAYLGGLGLTASQVTIVQSAVAEYNPPPVGTFVIHQISAPAPTGTGGTTAGRLGNVAGLHASHVYSNSAQIQWSPVHGATGYTVECKQGSANGTTASGPFAVSQTTANFGNLKAKTHYTALVWPGNGGSTSEPHAETSFTTT